MDAATVPQNGTCAIEMESLIKSSILSNHTSV